MKKMVFILTEIVSPFLFDGIDFEHVLLGCCEKNRTNKINILQVKNNVLNSHALDFMLG